MFHASPKVNHKNINTHIKINSVTSRVNHMKKIKIATLLCLALILSGIISSTIIAPAKASIQAYNWIGAEYRGYDSFYGTDITAFETGSTATLTVSVYNDFWPDWWGWYLPINVSKVMVSFDWGTNYTSTEANEANPALLKILEARTFKISFTVPSESVVSNLVTHSYTIRIEHINSQGDLVGTWTTYGFDFAVYLNDQTTAQRSHRILTTIFNASTASLPSDSRKLLMKARNQTAVGEIYYGLGNFVQSKQEFESALNTANNALSIEPSDFDQSKMNFYNSFSIISWAFLLIGIGTILIGIGTIIRRGKKI